MFGAGKAKVLREQLPEDQPYSALFGFKAQTIPGVFLERCRRTPNRIAFRYKRLGIYQGVTWQEYLRHVEDFCLGLLELGLAKGDRVAIMGDVCPEWMYADLAGESAGAVSFGVYPTCSVAETKYQLENAGATVFVAENQEYVDKVMPVIDELPSLRHIVVADTRGMFGYDDQRIITFAEVERLGARRRQIEPNLFEELVERAGPSDAANLVYTSGTSGPPKGVMITHYNWLWGFMVFLDELPDFAREDNRLVSFLTYAHVMGKMYNFYGSIVAGYTIFIPENKDTVPETLVEVSPTCFAGVPRNLEKFAHQVLVGIESSSWLKKRAYRLAMSIGRRYIQTFWAGRVPSFLLRLGYSVSYLAVFRPILRKLGLAETRVAVTGGAPLPPEVAGLLQTWGVNVLEGYGCTETGSISNQNGRFLKPGNCGIKGRRVQIAFSDGGEILIKSPACTNGYWRSDEATRALLRDGWVHTGDVGSFTEEGYLVLRDRLKDIMITSGGKNISPSEIEKVLKGSPYITEAVVFADKRKYATCLIEIDFDSVAEWARAQELVYTSYSSLAAHPAVNALIEAEVVRLNNELGRVEQIKKFRLLPKELDPEDSGAPITATRKVKRASMYEKYRELVESMYEDGVAAMPEMGAKT